MKVFCGMGLLRLGLGLPLLLLEEVAVGLVAMGLTVAQRVTN
jgi:hypothetical protein